MEVLEAAENKIFDLIEFEMCFKLKRLNLRKNLIEDEDNIFFLTGLTELNYLNLNENPIKLKSDYKQLIAENLSFVSNIDIDEIQPTSMPRNNANLNYDEVFDLQNANAKDISDIKNEAVATHLMKISGNKANNTTSNKSSGNIRVNSDNTNNASNFNSVNNNTHKEQIENSNKFLALSKAKFAKFDNLKNNIAINNHVGSINNSNNNIINRNKNTKETNEHVINSNNNNDVTNQASNSSKSKANLIGTNSNFFKSKIVIDASKSNSNIATGLLGTGLSSKTNSKTSLIKIDEKNKINLFEKNRVLTKDELMQKIDNMNKALNQKSQEVTKRLYPIRNLEEYEKFDIQSLGKIKIIQEGSYQNANNQNQALICQIPGLLKKKKDDSKNLVLPKIKDLQLINNETDKKIENKTTFLKSENTINKTELI